MKRYDVIVLGTGGVGSATAMQLGRRGARTLGLDRFAGAHAHGSSHGETRIIRRAYFEHPDYVPLLNRAYDLWRELEVASGQDLYQAVGLVESGPANGTIVKGVLEAARQHHLAVEVVAPEDVADRFPFTPPEGHVSVYEQDAGFLFVEKCVTAHLEQAERAGVELVAGETVVDWRANQSGVVVDTETTRYEAAMLIVTAGAWANGLLRDLGFDLSIRRKHLHWYACSDDRFRAVNGCPGFFFETPNGLFYGFPEISKLGVKVSEHSGGTEILDPLEDDKSLEPTDQARVEAFLQSYLPGVSTISTRHEVCYYSMSHDEHFIVDRHPMHDNVVFAAGLSGHGFKFANVLGEMLAQLVLEGETNLPIDFLSCRRDGVRSQN